MPGRWLTPLMTVVAATAVAGLAASLVSNLAGAAEKAPPLAALGVAIEQTSVSGISSGAYMAGQFQMAHSSIVAGAAIIAGGPYGCAESFYADLIPGPGTAFLNLSKAINGCMLNALVLWGVPNPQLLADKARRLAEQGRIDPIEDAADDRVYLFSGKEDRTVVPAIVDAAADFYKRIGVKPQNLVEVKEIGAGHAFVTESDGLACGVSEKPYVVDCDYDQAGALLRHIYGELKPRADTPTGRFVTFDQTPFFDGLSVHGLADVGEAYVPGSCEQGARCRVHIAFHGCAQNEAAAGAAFVRNTGFARWADSNAIVVLFPQAAITPVNPQACWDWWGYTGHDYLTREAPQIVAVRRMLDRLAAPRPPS